MRICMTVRFSFPGITGTPLHAMQVARKIKENGGEIFVVQFKIRGKLEKDLYEGIEVFRIPFISWFTYLMLSTVNMFKGLSYLLSLQRYCGYLQFFKLTRFGCRKLNCQVEGNLSFSIYLNMEKGFFPKGVILL